MRNTDDKLDYATPPPKTGRTIGLILQDVAIGAGMIACGSVVAVIGYFVTLFIEVRHFDRPLDLIPNGVKRILHGREKT